MIYSEKEKRVLTAFIYRPIMTNIIAFVMQIGLNNKINLQETSDIILEMENIDFVNSNYLNNATNYKGSGVRIKNIYEQRCHSYFMEIVFRRYCDCLLKKEHNLFIHDTMGSTLSVNKVKSNDMLISDFCKNNFNNAIEELVFNKGKLDSNYKDIIMTILDPSVPMNNKKFYLNRFSSKDVKIIQEVVEQFLTDFIVYVVRSLNNNNLPVFIKYIDSLKNMLTSFYTKKGIEEINGDVIKLHEEVKDPDSLVVETMLDSGLFRLDWARRFYGSIDKFNGCVSRLKNKNPLLYERCQKEFSKEKELVSELIDKVCYYLENKIKLEDGSYRNFTIIDYYSLTTLSIESLNIMIRGIKLEYNKTKLLRDFISSSLRGSYINEKDALAINFFMNIGSEKRNLLLEEKKALINYMNENGIPMRTETYSSLVTEYARGRILLPHNNK